MTCSVHCTYIYLFTLFSLFLFHTDCPEPVNVLAIVGGVVAGILAVGLLLLLLWKFLIHIHDTREFAKFEKERQNAKWDTVSITCCH